MSNEMNDHDSIRMARDGLRRAASGCKEMAVLKKSKNWLKLAEELLVRGEQLQKMYNQRKFRRTQLLQQADHIAKTLGGDERLIKEIGKMLH